jgi:hypothetical protein
VLLSERSSNPRVREEIVTSPMFMPEPVRKTLMLTSAKLRSRPDQLLGELQGALAELADVEFRYDLARERLSAGDSTEAHRRSLIDLEGRRERKRKPLIDKVQELQRRMFDQFG